MIRSILVFLLFFSLFGLQAQPPHYGCHHSHHKLQTAPLTAAQQLALKASMERSDTFDIKHYEIYLEVLDFSNEWIKGNCAIDFEAKMNGQSLLRLDLMDMQIDSIIGPSGPLTYNYDSLFLEVNLPVAMNIGDSSTLTIYYQGSPTPDPSWGGFKFDGNYAYNLGIGLNSNPYNIGRSWFPCFDNFVERATIGISVMTEIPRRAYAIGTFMGETVINNDSIVRQYLMSQPVTTYITSVAVSEYAQVDYTHSAMNGNLPFQLVARTGDTAAMRTTFVQLDDAVDALESWWGPYSWERVGFVATPQGAMEHPTNIAYPVGVATGGNTFGHKRLMTHELGHCWWGDLVTLSSPANMWIKEGNAEYSAHLLTEFVEGHEPFINQVKANHKDVLRSAHFEDAGYQPLSGIPFEHTYGKHTYNKGAAMIHNMRTYLGDSLFRVGQQSVLNTFAYDAIDAYQYRDELTAATGVDMTSFFQDWILSPGYSAFEINNIQSTPNGGNFDLSIEIEQKLRGTTNYHTNVPIQISLMDQNWNEVIVDRMVSGQTTTVTATLPFEPVAWFVNKNNTLNLAQMHGDFLVNSTLSNQNIPYADALLNVNSVTDSFLFVMEHYWVGADSIINNPNNARVSANHYWRVNGTFDDIDGNIRLTYDAYTLPQFDLDLVGTTEDSLILVYRPNASMDWKEYPYYTKIDLFNTTDGNGFIRIDTILKGEYAFANGDLPMYNVGVEATAAQRQSLQLFPNPAQRVLNIKGQLRNQKNKLNIELYDLQGQLVQYKNYQLPSGAFQIQMELADLPAGVYWLKMSDENGLLIDAQAVGVVD